MLHLRYIEEFPGKFNLEPACFHSGLGHAFSLYQLNNHFTTFSTPQENSELLLLLARRNDRVVWW